MRLVARAALFILVPTVLTWPAKATEAPRARIGARASLPAHAPPVRASSAERRAVRGVPLEEVQANESPELRALRRFEEEAFPRPGAFGLIQPEPDDVAKPLPPGLRGRWGGTGDIPRLLRSPESGSASSEPAPDKAWLNELTLPGLPVRWEPEVIRYLEYFKSDPRGRGTMAVWLRRMSRYQEIIERELDSEGLPRDLIYLAMIESGFDPGAISHRSAGGIWQFMPAAARAYGLEVSRWVDARRDPERAVEAAAHMLKDLYIRFGTWPLAFAAYNAGYGAVLRSIARFNTNDFWELARHEAGLPWETTLYVPKILAAAIIGHNLEAFGFANIARDPPWVFDRVEVSAGISFAMLARAAGARPDVITDLNPEYIANRVPPDRPSVVMRVPQGSGSLFIKAAGRARDSQRVQTVVLRFGETVEDLAKAHGSSVREIKRLNMVSDTDELRGGMTVLVPDRPAPAARRPVEEDEPILVAVPDHAFAYPNRERVFYRTRSSDTLADIAAVFGVTQEELVEWNNIDPRAKLQAKLILQLFVDKEFDRRDVVLLDPDKIRVVTLGSEEFLELETARRGKTRLFYAARAGDTLAKIAKRYGLHPGDLARVNRLSATSELTEGQRIVVYSPTPELPKAITARVTGAPRKPVLAAREVASTSRRRERTSKEKGKPANTEKASKGKSPSASTRKTTNGNGKKPTNGKH